ncbi:MAG TPA: glycosyltransferase family 2 protein [Lachnospiraceae bacterium]|nr:glycosyltransferase family 2 protein [Lachnospiraceae bacterium]
MDEQSVCAGIVSFNPNIKRLQENLETIHTQVQEVAVFDNGSVNLAEVETLLDKYPNACLIKSDENKGIATALNYLMQWGREHGYSWMVSLDQDSVCDSGFIEKMAPYLKVENNIGIAAPVIVERNVGVVGHNPEDDYAHVNTCITSGSITSTEAWRKIGGYDNSMFIDSVDFEFCYRMRKSGYGVIQVSSVRLVHELGNSKKRRFLFWKVDVTGHSAFRKYYIARNNVYYPLKHRLWLHWVRGNLRNAWLIILVLLYEADKRDKISSLGKGWSDGNKRGFKG